MNLQQFLKEELISRAIGARALKDDLQVNKIHIKDGCSSDGIEILSGIEELAEIMDEELHEGVYSVGKFIVDELWFSYGSDETDTIRFYQREYREDKAQPKNNPAARGEF